MKTVYKYKIPEVGPLLLGDKLLTLPRGAKIVAAGFAGSDPTEAHVWAEVDTDQTEMEFRGFTVFPTGSEIPNGEGDDYRHHLTFFDRSGAYVWHLYEKQL